MKPNCGGQRPRDGVFSPSTFTILWVLAQRYPRHDGIILAAQISWALSDLVAPLNRTLLETKAENWIGQVRWLNEWRRRSNRKDGKNAKIKHEKP
jgi:hypothetical protein